MSTTEPVADQGRRPSRRQGRGRSALWLLALPACAVSLTILLDVAVLAPLQSLAWLAGAALVLLGAVAVLTRQWRLALATLLAGAVSLAPIASGSLPVGTRATGTAISEIRVLAVNLQFGRTPAREVLAAVAAKDANLVVLSEVTPASLRDLDAAGVATRLPHRVGAAAEGASGTVVLSAFPLRDRGTLLSLFLIPVVEAQTPLGPVTVVGIHTAPPQSPTWRSDLRGVTEWLAQRDPDERLVLAGDFNSGVEHPAFRALLATTEDAHRQLGQEWRRSWPVGAHLEHPLLRHAPAFTRIDHILVRGFRARDAGYLELARSDHRAPWAHLDRE